MSIVFELSPSRALSSSSLTRTYWSLETSYPRTSGARSTVSLQTGQNVCCLMREPHFAWSWLKATLMEEAAVYILTGMETSPKEIVPEPIEWGGIAVATIPPGPYDSKVRGHRDR